MKNPMSCNQLRAIAMRQDYSKNRGAPKRQLGCDRYRYQHMVYQLLPTVTGLEVTLISTRHADVETSKTTCHDLPNFGSPLVPSGKLT
jgi:hypothetical protein